MRAWRLALALFLSLVFVFVCCLLCLAGRFNLVPHRFACSYFLGVAVSSRKYCSQDCAFFVFPYLIPGAVPRECVPYRTDMRSQARHDIGNRNPGLFDFYQKQLMLYRFLAIAREDQTQTRAQVRHQKRSNPARWCRSSLACLLADCELTIPALRQRVMQGKSTLNLPCPQLIFSRASVIEAEFDFRHGRSVQQFYQILEGGIMFLLGREYGSDCNSHSGTKYCVGLKA